MVCPLLALGGGGGTTTECADGTSAVVGLSCCLSQIKLLSPCCRHGWLEGQRWALNRRTGELWPSGLRVVHARRPATSSWDAAELLRA